MSADRKKRWRKEIDWLLCVSDYIVEFVPSQQKSKDGSNMEVQSLPFSSLSFTHTLTHTHMGALCNISHLDESLHVLV